MAELAESLKKISAVDDALTHWMEAIRGMIATPEVRRNHLFNRRYRKFIFQNVHPDSFQHSLSLFLSICRRFSRLCTPVAEKIG